MSENGAAARWRGGHRPGFPTMALGELSAARCALRTEAHGGYGARFGRAVGPRWMAALTPGGR